jgi:hypothetical protein
VVLGHRPEVRLVAAADRTLWVNLRLFRSFILTGAALYRAATAGSSRRG